MKYISKKDIKLPHRKPFSKKGDNGKVLIIGGSPDYIGAPALAGLAALRSGADIVTIAAPKKVGWVINGLSPDLIVKKINCNYFTSKNVNELLKTEQKYDIILIGNGIGLKSKEFIKDFIKKTQKPLVIDADAIKSISIKNVKNAILTPHKKEFEILLKNSNLKNKKELQKHLRNNIIILKGKTDEIITKNKTYYNKTGNAGMTKAGTGDVLAGLIAGFYAQNKDALMSSKIAVYYNGLIGDILLKKKKGFTYLASDIIEEIKKIKSSS